MAPRHTLLGARGPGCLPDRTRLGGGGAGSGQGGGASHTPGQGPCPLPLTPATPPALGRERWDPRSPGSPHPQAAGPPGRAIFRFSGDHSDFQERVQKGRRSGGKGFLWRPRPQPRDFQAHCSLNNGPSSSPGPGPRLQGAPPWRTPRQLGGKPGEPRGPAAQAPDGGPCLQRQIWPGCAALFSTKLGGGGRGRDLPPQQQARPLVSKPSCDTTQLPDAWLEAQVAQGQQQTTEPRPPAGQALSCPGWGPCLGPPSLPPSRTQTAGPAAGLPQLAQKRPPSPLSSPPPHPNSYTVTDGETEAPRGKGTGRSHSVKPRLPRGPKVCQVPTWALPGGANPGVGHLPGAVSRPR